MQGNLLIKAVCLGVVLGVMLSCASKKPTIAVNGRGKEVSRTTRLNLIRQVTAHQLNFTTFSGRAKSKITVNRDQYDVTANVRIERDKAIWISMTALMGIEAGRVLITPDSIKIINRLQGAYVNQPFEYLGNFTNDELDFFSLQQLLVGNVLQETITKDAEIRANDPGYVIRNDRGDLTYSVQLDTAYRPIVMVLKDTSRNEAMEASYQAYQSFEGRLFPSQVKIAIATREFKLLGDMRFSRIVYDETLEMPFHIPAKYKEIQ